LGLLWRV